MTQPLEAPPGEPPRLIRGAAAPAVSRGPVLAEGYDALDANGSVVHLRPVTGSDGPQLKALCRRISPRSRYQRFLGASGVVAEQYLARVSTGDLTLDAVVALRRGTITGLGSTHPMSGRRAEFALLVDDAVHAAGVGTLLAEELVARSLARGVNELCAEVLRTNAQVLDLLQHLGLPWRWRLTTTRCRSGSTCGTSAPTASPWRDANSPRELVAVRAEPGGVAPHPPAAAPGGGNRTCCILPHTPRARLLRRFLLAAGLDVVHVVATGDLHEPSALDVLAAAADIPGARVAVLEASSVTNPVALAKSLAAIDVPLVLLLDPRDPDAEQLEWWCRRRTIQTADSVREAARLAAQQAATGEPTGPPARRRGPCLGAPRRTCPQPVGPPRRRWQLSAGDGSPGSV